MADLARLTALSEAFSPSAPIDQQALFAGRLTQLTDLMNAINQKGQHAILYGERGVGKTSLARVLSRAQLILNGKSVIVASINCDASMTFSSLWHRLAREITISQTRQPAGFTAGPVVQQVPMNCVLPEVVTPDDVKLMLSCVGKSLIVIDELDRLEDEKAPTLLADTIKTLSDHAVDSTVLLVGVAESVDTLIGEHLSIERALVQIRMPRMSPPELEEIISKGLTKAAMTIDEGAKKRIVQLSQGLPHYTHLLTQSAAQRAAQTDRVNVEDTDVRSAIDAALNKAQQSTVSAYHEATASARENMYKQVLLACAMAKSDEVGSFSAVDVRDALALVMGKRYEIPAFSQHLNAFCEFQRGPMLVKTGTARRYRFRFANPLMQPYVIMNGLKNGLIKEGQLKCHRPPYRSRSVIGM